MQNIIKILLRVTLILTFLIPKKGSKNKNVYNVSKSDEKLQNVKKVF